jgi:hypothetical protein
MRFTRTINDRAQFVEDGNGDTPHWSTYLEGKPRERYDELTSNSNTINNLLTSTGPLVGGGLMIALAAAPLSITLVVSSLLAFGVHSYLRSQDKKELSDLKTSAVAEAASRGALKGMQPS